VVILIPRLRDRNDSLDGSFIIPLRSIHAKSFSSAAQR
jgi:hypothetical protein